jgi:hypothetical protein
VIFRPVEGLVASGGAAGGEEVFIKRIVAVEGDSVEVRRAPLPRAAAARRRRRSRRRSRAASAAASLPSPLPRCVCPVAGPLPAPHAARAPSLRARRPPQVRDGRLLVNGAAADEPFVSERAGYSLARLVVPPGDVRPAAARTCPGPRASPPAACTARL